MKLTHYIYMAVLGLLSASCANDAPTIPAEELYLRNFIKTFGLIDPNQDWNLAETARVDLRLDKPASKIVVYANVFDSYYRVARCYSVPDGGVRIKLDIPVNTTDLAVDVDGEVYIVAPNGFVDTSAYRAQLRSRAVPENPYLNESDELGWLIVAEDLGSTDDVDFNDIVVRMSYNENTYTLYGDLAPDVWDVIDQNTDDELYISRAGDSRVTDGKMEIKIKAVAAGGIKKIFLHYRADENATDYIIGPEGSVVTSSIGSESAANPYEWHYWFNHSGLEMLNTRVASTPIFGAVTTFEVDDDFTFTKYSQMTYEHPNPSDVYNFDFNRRNIEGFYITVDTHEVVMSGNTAAYDLGKAIGHTREVGLPPQMFLIPDLCPVSPGSNVKRHFRWPLERVGINEAYESFDTWVSDGVTTWYKDAVEMNVVSDNYVKRVYGE